MPRSVRRRGARAHASLREALRTLRVQPPEGSTSMRTIGAILATFLAWAAAGPAAAQTSYPDRPVRIIVGFTPGSATDITARIFAQKFSEAWGVAVTVENVPGAGGTVGLDRVAKAAPDGYTLAWAASGALTIGPSLQS